MAISLATGRAASLAALGIVLIQVGSGVVQKHSQTHIGKFDASPSEYAAVTEFWKLLLSLAFFWIERNIRVAKGARHIDTDASYAALNQHDDSNEDGDVLEMQWPTFGTDNTRNGNAFSSLRLRLQLFWRYISNEVPRGTKYELCCLALLYIIASNVKSTVDRHIDPGTAALAQSGVTVFTGFLLTSVKDVWLSVLQWPLIALQVYGLTFSQNSDEYGITYPLDYSNGTCFLLGFSLFLTASAGVYNQVLLKRDENSLHANNIILFAAGTIFNSATYLVTHVFEPTEYILFSGLWNVRSFVVIVGNVVLGLAVTAAYKYANALIACLATTFSAGILIYISHSYYGVVAGSEASCGSTYILLSLILYIVTYGLLSPPSSKTDSASKPFVYGISSLARKWPERVLGGAISLTIIIVALFCAPETSLKHVVSGSPFKNTLAYVRWNSHIPERLPMVMKYETFFHTMHISMPDSIEGQDDIFLNTTHDQFNEHRFQHQPVADTLKLVLQHQPDIEGMLFFHFDAWISPMDYVGIDLTKIWRPFYGDPDFQCFDELPTDNWKGDDKKDNYEAVGRAILERPPHLNGTEGESLAKPELYISDKRAGCRGWSDVYYLPRRFFEDFIFLVDHAFGGIFHEMAVPSMMHIIESTRNQPGQATLIEQLSCWGSCCSEHPASEMLLWYGCGHRLDYQDELMTSIHYNRIDAASAALKSV